MRLAVSQQLSASTMPKFVASFVIFTQIFVTLTDCSVDDVVEHIENLEADLGVAPERVHSDDLQAVVLFSSPFYLVLPATHPFAKKKDVLRWTDLLNERLITLNGPFIKVYKMNCLLKFQAVFLTLSLRVNFFINCTWNDPNGTWRNLMPIIRC